jgi:hypothetical protein
LPQGPFGGACGVEVVALVVGCLAARIAELAAARLSDPQPTLARAATNAPTASAAMDLSRARAFTAEVYPSCGERSTFLDSSSPDAAADADPLIRERHRAIRERDPSLGALPDRLFLAIIHGVRAMVCRELDIHPEPQLTELADDVLLWITATFEGAAAAQQPKRGTR